MYEGKFHNSKLSNDNKTNDDIEIYFSPQDKPIENCILNLIREAKQYIRISAFVITENRITTELINANKRGVDIKIIVDALNASTQHSKHKELRSANIKVKAENYAGKMHSKSIIVDDEYVILGSMNFSNSGNKRSDENIVVLKNKQAAMFYRAFFDYQWDRIADKWLKYTPRAEGKDSIGSCSDGIDNNYDGKTDSEDDACKSD
jgi:phosphatidylserine/phosphatidylglycerophosphate/cardiolipin synthase-like enzyme